MKVEKVEVFHPITIKVESIEELHALRFAMYNALYEDKRFTYSTHVQSQHIEIVKALYSQICY